MIVISLAIIILYVLGLFLPIIKNTKESNNFIKNKINYKLKKKKNIILRKCKKPCKKKIRLYPIKNTTLLVQLF